MRRREFAKLVAATVAWPMVASARQRMPVIGFLSSSSPGAGTAANVAGFQQGLSENGFVAGKNIEFNSAHPRSKVRIRKRTETSFGCGHRQLNYFKPVISGLDFEGVPRVLVSACGLADALCPSSWDRA